LPKNDVREIRVWAWVEDSVIETVGVVDGEEEGVYPFKWLNVRLKDGRNPGLCRRG
jgi:hypothetical protein